jgi:hypothetical protein
MQDLNFRTGVISPVECVKEGYELIKSDFWLMLGIWLVGGLIGGLTFGIVTGAMMCGTFYCYLRKIDGQPVKFDDLWKGMQYFLPGLIVIAFILVPIIFVYAGIYIPFIIAAVMGGRLDESELVGLFVGVVVIEVIVIFGMVCLHTLLMFAFPLIVDKNIGGFKAISTSARAVLKNLGGVIGLIGVNFVLVLAGYMALCIGVYFVIPIIIAGNVVAYRKVFPRTSYSY